VIKIAIFLFGVYLGTIMTMRSSDELYVSIPFVRLTQAAQKKKDLVVDVSVLADPPDHRPRIDRAFRQSTYLASFCH
jgi:hypothetical protein